MIVSKISHRAQNYIWPDSIAFSLVGGCWKIGDAGLKLSLQVPRILLHHYFVPR